MALEIEIEKVYEELRLTQMDHERIMDEKYLLEMRRNSLIKLLTEATKRSKLLNAQLRK